MPNVSVLTKALIWLDQLYSPALHTQIRGIRCPCKRCVPTCANACVLLELKLSAVQDKCVTAFALPTMSFYVANGCRQILPARAVLEHVTADSAPCAVCLHDTVVTRNASIPRV